MNAGKLAIVVIFSLIISTAGAGEINSFLTMPDENNIDTEIVSMSLNFSNPHVMERGEYACISVNGAESHIAGNGVPYLPEHAQLLKLPFGAKIEEVYVKVGETKEMQIDKKIMLSPEAIELNGESMETSFRYESNEPYPSKWVEWNVGAGIENGEHVVFLSIHAFPARYIPAENELQYVNNMSIEIKYTPPSKPLLTNELYDLLIIAPSEFSDGLQPLVEHKNSHNVDTILVTLDEIYNGNYFSVQGRDDAEKIKYFIKDAVEQWGVKYVMLVGGRHGGVATEKWWCPVRYANVDDNSNWETSFLSDLYFADIYKYDNGNATFEDWDSNGNGKFAEFKMASRDKVDLYPDVYVGRLACRNNYEVQKMVEKIITYETTTYNSDWFRKLVVVGGDSAPMEGDPYYEGEEENKVAIEHMDGFEPVKLWTSTGTLTDSESVINAVNQGCGFLFFDGHGNPMSWATHPPYDENTWIDGLKVQDMKKLTNEGKYPVCVVGGCHNAQFNVSMLNLLKIYKGYEEWYRYVYRGEISPETWAWWLARKFDGGSIATIGFSGLDWFATGDSDGDGVPDCTQYFSGFLNVHFFMEYGDNGLRVLGEIHGHAIADYLNELFPSSEPLDYKSVEEWVLLGDPSLMVGGYP